MNREDFKKYINDNRSLFDDKEPETNHINRFEEILKTKSKKEHRHFLIKRTSIILSIAASVAILVTLFVKNNTYTDPIIPIENNHSISGFQQTNEYYSQQMKEQISDIMCKLAHTDREDQEILTEDLERIMSENSDFINEIVQNENKEQAVHYLIKHYKTNIRILEDINKRLGRNTNC